MRVNTITVCTAKKAGRKDGRALHPPIEYNGSRGQISDFEKRLSAVAEEWINKFIGEWQKLQNAVLMEIKTLGPELKGALKNLEAEISAHRLRFDEGVRPEPRHRYSKSSYLLLFLLFLVEGGINIYTFRFLREPGITTVVIGLAVALMIPFTGFRAGRILRQRGNTIAEWTIGILLLAGSVFLIFVVAEGRRIAVEARNLDPRVVEETFLIFLVANFLLFTIALWDGYVSGYTYPKLQKAYEELRRRKRHYADRWGRLNDAFARMLAASKTQVAAAEGLKTVYQQANRRAREKKQRPVQLPEYFKNGTPLPIVYPEEIKPYIRVKDPEALYRANIFSNVEYSFLKEAEESYKQIIQVLQNVYSLKGS